MSNFHKLVVLCCLLTGYNLNGQISVKLDSGLVGYYPFNGNANDESGNNHNGTVLGATLTTDRCGIPNSAYYFNGNISYIQINNPSITFPEFTYSLWASLSSLLLDGGTSILLSTGSSGGDQHIQYNNNYAGFIGWFFGGYNTNSNSYDLNQGYLPDLNQWYLLSVTRSENKVKFYINGILVKSDSTYTPILPYYGTGEPQTIIGSRFDLTLPFNGKIDEVRIYNRVLSIAEIDSLYFSNCSHQDLGEINGSKIVCQGQKKVGYKVTGMDSIKSYVWGYSGTGATIAGNSDSISMDFSNNATNGSLIVIGNKINENGIDSAILSITVNSCNTNCDINLQNGLVAYYPFNGNANDESGNGHNGKVNGATLTSDRCGKLNSAYYFDGISNNNITINPDSFYFKNFTYSAWFKSMQTPSLNSGTVIIDIGGSGGDQVLGLNNSLSSYTTGFTFGGYSSSNGISETYIAITSIGSLPELNKWYNLIITRSDDSIKLYINSILSSYNSTQNTLPFYAVDNSSLFILGSRYNGLELANGVIDDVRIYKRVLNSCEIDSLYYTSCSNNISDHGKINGSKLVCQGQKKVGYKVTGMDSIKSYVWGYSGTGATIAGNSDSISMDFSNNATSGNLIVLGNKISGIGTDTTILPIVVNSLPFEAGEITGDNKVCLNQSGLSYYISPIENASSYIWDFNGSGATIIGNSNNININFGPSATKGNLNVWGINLCGIGIKSLEFSITVDSCNQGYSGNLNIPNSFSPNNDGINDFFVIRGLTENSKLLIFDRFGRKVYESDNYQNDWDGNDNKGKSLPTETYWYVFTLQGFPTEFKGFVYLKK